MKRVAILTVALTASLAGQGSPQTNGSFLLIAGDGQIGYSPDGTSAVAAALNSPTAVAVTPSGGIVFADRLNYLVRTVTSSGNLLTIAGNGCVGGGFGSGCFNGDGGPATSASIGSVYGLATDAVGNIYIADSSNQRIREVGTSGNIIRTIAGNGAMGFSGDGGSAVGASLNSPRGVAVDRSGNVFFADTGNHRIRMIDSQRGTITTIAGTGVQGYSGDQGPAINAALNAPTSVSLDGVGNLFIADSGNNRVRKLSSDGTITTVAGNGVARFAGDGGLATAASLNDPLAVSVDQLGNFYIADYNNKLVRKVTPDGFISSLAYGGGPSFLGAPRGPYGLATDRSGNVFISDLSGNQIAEFIPTRVTITSIVNAASFQAGIVPNSWMTILGTGLSSNTDTWATAIVGGNLPSFLDGVSVNVGGQPAYISYISPAQINALAPNVGTGTVSVTVTNSSGTSSTVAAVSQTLQPAFFQWGSYAVATRQDYSLAVKNGALSGQTTMPAKPGEVIIVWGTGFGPTSSPAPIGAGVPPSPTYYTASAVAVTVGNTAATVYGAALAPGYAGLYQVAIQIPTSLANGDYAVIATVSGKVSPSITLITVQN
jgi:uncharacterized protein (TIGR03437 family)